MPATGRASGGHSSARAWLRRVRILSILLARDADIGALREQLQADFAPDPAFESEKAAPFALRRDIRHLNRLPGCEIRWIRQVQAYRLLASPLHVRFPAEDVHAIQVLRGLLQEHVPHREEALAFLDRLARQASPKQMRELQRKPPVLLAGLSEDVSEFHEELMRIELAVADRCDIVFLYEPGRDPQQQEEWQVQPLELRIQENHLYLDAWNHRVHQSRLFRVDRMVKGSVEILPQLRPDVARRTREILVRLRVSRALAPYGIARRWPQRQEVKDADGSVILEMAVPNRFEAVRLVHRYGPQVECLGPPEVRAQVAEDIRQLHEMYVCEKPEDPGTRRP